MTVRQCLEEAGRLLQEEVDKQLRCDSEELGNNEKAATASIKEAGRSHAASPPAPAMMVLSGMDMEGVDMDDPMIAEFFAKQNNNMSSTRTTKPTDEKAGLPVQEWAANIIQAARQKSGAVLTPCASESCHPGEASLKQQELIDRLYATFRAAQDSS